jgi:prevent-host-death family protein
MDVGACEARTEFSDLLDRVERGEEVVTARRGQAVVRLVPAQPRRKRPLDEAISTRARSSSRCPTSGGPSFRWLSE